MAASVARIVPEQYSPVMVKHAEHTDQQQAGDHAGQRVVGQVAGGVPGVQAHGGPDADGRRRP